MVPFLSSNSCVIHSCHISSSPRGSFRFEIFFVSRRESVAFSRTSQSTTSAFRPSDIDCLTTSDGFKFGFLEETVPQRREWELFFSLGKYAYQRGRYEPHIRGAGIPCTFELNKKQRWSIFHNLYTPRCHSCFSQTGLYWLCHVAA